MGMSRYELSKPLRIILIALQDIINFSSSIIALAVDAIHLRRGLNATH